MKKSLLTTAMAVLSAASFAQTEYITEAPAGGFDFNTGTDYVVIYSPDEQTAAMGSNILSDQNLDPTMADNQFFYWVADWDKKLFTLYDIDDDQANSYGGSEKLNMTPLFAWGAGHFGAKAKKYDLSSITEDHILHIGFMNIGSETATNNFVFKFGPKGDNFQLVVNKEVGQLTDGPIGVGFAPELNTWYYLDIPIKDLIDEDGDFGFEANFAGGTNDIVFTAGFAGATASKYTQGDVDIETGMYEISIDEKGSAMAIDGVFLYKADDTDTAIKTVATDKQQGDAIYNLAGQRVGNNYKGVVVKNGRKVLQ